MRSGCPVRVWISQAEKKGAGKVDADPAIKASMFRWNCVQQADTEGEKRKNNTIGGTTTAPVGLRATVVNVVHGTNRVSNRLVNVKTPENDCLVPIPSLWGHLD